MRISRILSIAAMALSMQAAMAQYPFKVISPVHGIDEGQTVYLVNFDTGEKVDSAQVSDASVTFTGEVDEPYVARIIYNGNRLCTFLLEQGTIAINADTRRAVGSMLNDRLNEITDSIGKLETKYSMVEGDDAKQAVLDQYEAYIMQSVEDNLDTALGYYLFLDVAYEMPVEEMMNYIEKHPELKEYQRVQGLIDGASHKLATSAGKKFVDFEVTYDGVTKKLSDYAGKGDYLLVDFWASWCGPCMKEIGTLKEIYSKYKDQGLKVLGVAVWDEPENTLGAIQRKEIPWECIINAQTIPTDLYGIAGIPCIMLIDPEGTIVFRDLQGDALKAAVEEALK